MSSKPYAPILALLTFVLSGPQNVCAEPAAVSAPSAADEAYAAYERILRERVPEGIDDKARGMWYYNNFAVVCDAAAQFIKDFPRDPRRWKAMDVFVMYTGNLERRSQALRKQADELVAQALQADDIDKDYWQRAKGHQISGLMMPAYRAVERGEQPDLSGLRRSIDELAARYPDAGNLGVYEMQYTDLLKKQNAGLAQAWLEHLSGSANEQVAKLASGKIRIAKMRQTPPELKFTAVDGREVDLEALRGKVVLIDFWATWCGPCVAELPNIKAAYDRYHRQGLEVVGISLDRKNDRQKLEDFITERNLPWPQFFDEENNSNRIAEQYGIFAIPTQLLLDRQGLLVHDAARGEALQEELKRLFGG